MHLLRFDRPQTKCLADAGLVVVVTADFGTDKVEMKSSPKGAKLVPLQGSWATLSWRIDGLGPGGVALLAPRGGTAGAKAAVVAALPAEPGHINYYGFRRDEW